MQQFCMRVTTCVTVKFSARFLRTSDGGQTRDNNQVKKTKQNKTKPTKPSLHGAREVKSIETSQYFTEIALLCKVLRWSSGQLEQIFQFLNLIFGRTRKIGQSQRKRVDSVLVLTRYGGGDITVIV